MTDVLFLGAAGFCINFQLVVNNNFGRLSDLGKDVEDKIRFVR